MEKHPNFKTNIGSSVKSFNVSYLILKLLLENYIIIDTRLVSFTHNQGSRFMYIHFTADTLTDSMNPISDKNRPQDDYHLRSNFG